MAHSSPATQCANCDTPVTSKFCGECGQATHVGRLHLHDLLHEVWHAFTHADKGIIRLTKELATRPRQVYLNYFAGQRRKYFSPVLYFLLFAGALAVLYPYVFDYEDSVNHMNNEFGRELYHLIKYRTLALLPIQVGLTWLVFRRSYNLTEITVFWLFCMGFMFVARLVLLPLYFPLIRHKAMLDYAYNLLEFAIILWQMVALFARRKLIYVGCCFLLILLVNIIDVLMQGYLIYGSKLFGMPAFSLGNILKVTFLPG